MRSRSSRARESVGSACFRRERCSTAALTSCRVVKETNRAWRLLKHPGGASANAERSRGSRPHGRRAERSSVAWSRPRSSARHSRLGAPPARPLRAARRGADRLQAEALFPWFFPKTSKAARAYRPGGSRDTTRGKTRSRSLPPARWFRHRRGKLRRAPPSASKSGTSPTTLWHELPHVHSCVHSRDERSGDTALPGCCRRSSQCRVVYRSSGFCQEQRARSVTVGSTQVTYLMVLAIAERYSWFRASGRGAKGSRSVDAGDRCSVRVGNANGMPSRSNRR